MPLYKTINISPTSQILVWKITESFEELLHKAVLKEKTKLRLGKMKSQLHQRGFLSVRMLLQEAGFNDFDLHYDSFGKPYLSCHRHISITHSYNFAAIIISEEAVGIDIELQRKKITCIADKFVAGELDYLNPENQEEYIKKLTVIWGAKEAIFKIKNEKGISFKNNIQVDFFELNNKVANASLNINNLKTLFDIQYIDFENFTLVYAFEKRQNQIHDFII